MSEKRKRDDADLGLESSSHKKRVNRGFKVGPDNLPDGAYKRKNQKIKRALIERARLKKSYAKFKRDAAVGNDAAPESSELPLPASAALDAILDPAPINTDPHPDRQALIEDEAENPAPAAPQGKGWGDDGNDDVAGDEMPKFQRKRTKQQRAMPFRKEVERAERKRVEAEEWRRAREEAERERAQRREERERFRKAMAKARTGGPNGQRKLGRESNVLLEKVRRMVGQSG